MSDPPRMHETASCGTCEHACAYISLHPYYTLTHARGRDRGRGAMYSARPRRMRQAASHPCKRSNTRCSPYHSWQKGEGHVPVGTAGEKGEEAALYVPQVQSGGHGRGHRLALQNRAAARHTQLMLPDPLHRGVCPCELYTHPYPLNRIPRLYGGCILSCVGIWLGQWGTWTGGMHAKLAKRGGTMLSR